MKKKIIMGSIFAALLMLFMPVVTTIQAQPAPTIIRSTENQEVTINLNDTYEGFICQFLRYVIHSFYTASEDLIERG